MMINRNEALTEDDARMYIKLLDMAKERIRSDQDEHICVALAEIAFEEPEYENYADTLILNIGRIIDPNSTLVDWYEQTTGEKPTYEQAKEMRLRWIDDSIKSIKQKMRTYEACRDI